MIRSDLEILRNAREKAGKSMRQVALELGVTEQSIWRWEKAVSSPRASILVRLCDAYGLSLETIQKWHAACVLAQVQRKGVA